MTNLTNSSRSYRAIFLGFGLCLALGGTAHSQDAVRDSIIQGVRDDVRRHIAEQQAREYRSEQMTVGQSYYYGPTRERKGNRRYMD